MLQKAFKAADVPLKLGGEPEADNASGPGSGRAQVNPPGFLKVRDFVQLCGARRLPPVLAPPPSPRSSSLLSTLVTVLISPPLEVPHGHRRIGFHHSDPFNAASRSPDDGM